MNMRTTVVYNQRIVMSVVVSPASKSCEDRFRFIRTTPLAGVYDFAPRFNDVHQILLRHEVLYHHQLSNHLSQRVY